MSKFSTYAVRLLPWVMISISICVSLYVPFNYWAVNADYFGKYDLGWALFFAISFAYALYASIGIALTSLAIAAIYKLTNKQGSKVLFYAFLVGLIPIAFILWLDYGR